MAEACGSRTQILDSQLTANDDVAASARFQLESIGVRTVHFPAKLCLIHQGLLPCFLLGLVSRTAELLTCVRGSRRKFPSFRTLVRFPSPAPQSFKMNLCECGSVRRLAPIELLRDAQFSARRCYVHRRRSNSLFLIQNSQQATAESRRNFSSEMSFSTATCFGASLIPAILSNTSWRSQHDRRGTDLRPATARPESDSEHSYGAGRAGLWRLRGEGGNRQEVSGGNAWSEPV